MVCSRFGFILAPGARVESTNVGATWENRNAYCTTYGLSRCVGCVDGVDCEYTLPGGYGYSVWYNLHTAGAATTYTVTVTGGTATGAVVGVHRNWDGVMNHLSPVRVCGCDC